jgi:hypothetical protein
MCGAVEEPASLRKTGFQGGTKVSWRTVKSDRADRDKKSFGHR